jgi:hypothetical protein
VTDRAASIFAQTFYRSMIEGRPIGEAMVRARLRVHECHPNDPTWLAYCCFANPLARIELRGPTSLEGKPSRSDVEKGGSTLRSGQVSSGR